VHPNRRHLHQQMGDKDRNCLDVVNLVNLAHLHHQDENLVILQDHVVQNLDDLHLGAHLTLVDVVALVDAHLELVDDGQADVELHHLHRRRRKKMDCCQHVVDVEWHHLLDLQLVKMEQLESQMDYSLVLELIRLQALGQLLLRD
jgi:hypothetical protein